MTLGSRCTERIENVRGTKRARRVAVALGIVCVLGGCTIEDEPTATDTTAADAAVDVDASTTTFDPAAVPDLDRSDSVAKDEIPIEGIWVDREQQCVSPEVTVLGGGSPEPISFAPRCLRHIDTGAVFIARRGSAALPQGYERCRMLDVVDYPVCGEATCSGEEVYFELEFACGLDAEPNWGNFRCGVNTDRPQEQAVLRWYNPHTTASIDITGQVLPAPWLRPQPENIDWIGAGLVPTCPEEQGE